MKKIIFLLLAGVLYSLAIFSQKKDDNQFRREWEAFYWEKFRLNCNFSTIAIPPYRDGFDSVVIIPQGISFQNIIKSYRNLREIVFGFFGEDELDSLLENHPSASYAIRIRGRQEGDKEFINKSPQELESVASMNLMEMLLYDLKCGGLKQGPIGTLTTTRFRYNEEWYNVSFSSGPKGINLSVFRGKNYGDWYAIREKIVN